MEENDNNKNQTPPKMARLAWPKAKYGIYIAVLIIIAVLFIYFRILFKILRLTDANL